MNEKIGMLVIHYPLIPQVYMYRCENGRDCNYNRLAHRYENDTRWAGFRWKNIKDENGQSHWFCPDCAYEIEKKGENHG